MKLNFLFTFFHSFNVNLFRLNSVRRHRSMRCRRENNKRLVLARLLIYYTTIIISTLSYKQRKDGTHKITKCPIKYCQRKQKAKKLSFGNLDRTSCWQFHRAWCSLGQTFFYRNNNDFIFFLTLRLLLPSPSSSPQPNLNDAFQTSIKVFKRFYRLNSIDTLLGLLKPWLW